MTMLKIARRSGGAAVGAATAAVAIVALLLANSNHVAAFVPVSQHVRVVRHVVGSDDNAVMVFFGEQPSGPRGAMIDGASLLTRRQWTLHMSNFIGMDKDDEDEDEDDDDEDDEDDDDMALSSSSRYSGARSPFTGMKLDPWDPNPLIKPRPSRFFKDSGDDSNDTTSNDTSSSTAMTSHNIPDDQLTQTMSDAERGENLSVLRQIQKHDLVDLRRRKDHAGWVEANNDRKRRLAKDPWFAINERLKDALQLGDTEANVTYLQGLAEKVGGPPPGIIIGKKGYAAHTEIYDIPLSPSRASALLEREMRQERAARGRAMMAERAKNLEAQQRQYEQDMRNPGVREDREAKERRERTMRRLMQELEDDHKKKRERAQEQLGKLPETPESRTASMEKAIKEARDEMKRMRAQQQQQGKGLGGANAGDLEKLESGLIDEDDEDDDDDDDDDENGRSRSAKSGAQKAREAAAAEATGGRPRLPGDADVTRGELSASMTVEPSSTTTTGPLEVSVTSSYNPAQSDPPMRKHCFQYTIRITNNSPTDTIQLLGRRFEIQTVGSSMKDVVQGEGVTGRTPVLKPGEVFEYTSTAPLSVRPIGTTIIAARMRGEYRYVVLQNGQGTASDEQLASGGDQQAELGTFHFIFPTDQRVQPFTSAETTGAADDDDEEDDEDDGGASAATASSAAAAPRASSWSSASSGSSSSSSSATTVGPTPSSTLPGDNDMKTGDIAVSLNDSSETVTDQVRVQVTSSYRPERSDEGLHKHCFAYNIRITNESQQPIQLVSRRFEIQTVGSANKDVVQGPGVTGRQPILKPGESFEYTSTAPLSVKPMLERTPAVARMQGEYSFVQLGNDGVTPVSTKPLQAKLGMFHFCLPALI